MAGAIIGGVARALPYIGRWGLAAAPAAVHAGYDYSPWGDGHYDLRDAGTDILAGLGMAGAGAIGGSALRAGLGTGVGLKAAGKMLPEAWVAGGSKYLPGIGAGAGLLGTGVMRGYRDAHDDPKAKVEKLAGMLAGDSSGGSGGSQSAMDEALKKLMGASTVSLTDKIVNKYLADSASPYDTAIANMHDDANDAVRRNNDISFNLGRDLAVGGRVSRARAKQEQRSNARRMEAEIGAQAAQDAALAQELGVDPGVIAGSSDIAKAGSTSTRAANDEAAMLMGESNASFADDAAMWAKADAAEQNRQLRRQEHKAVGKLNADKAAGIAQTQFALQQMQIQQAKDQAQNQFDIAKLMTQGQQDQQMVLWKMLAPFYQPHVVRNADGSQGYGSPDVSENDFVNLILQQLGIGG